ncbi:carbamoyl-phosphate synthase [Bacillus thuringiensis]|uniref:Carbamoyl-phosphate synthase n=1 Tax=Bacillus thuringiensis TaxID=1428 RepID=A0A9X7C253_BACTU|nr:carbamoyl-phosphate synthase [Bacillus thuringiensis]PGH85766.1 carbamoyl-phosphate synthase [Bacillus thuringiensis]
MADGSVHIETGLDTGDVRAQVERLNRELDQIGRDMNRIMRRMSSEYNEGFDSMGRYSRRVYRGTSEEAQRMYSEMASANRQQSIAMRGIKDQMISAQYQYFKLAQASQTYTGTTREFLAEVERVGKAQKAANDAEINANRLKMMSMLQTIGYMQNMTTQATRITENYNRMANPIYRINNAGLAAANSLNRLANAGNASVLALKMLGPTASMKDLLNMQMMITQGLLRMQMVALMAAASCVVLYSSLHNANMEMNPKYAEAYNNMIEKLTKALEPMRDAFAAVMIPVYNFVSAMADLIIKFNEAHPVLAKFIQGTMMLIPLLTLILSPLAIGIGLWNGMLAAWSSIWMLIGPLITGLAAMSATVWLVAAAISGLVVGFTYLWKTNEKFRSVITESIGAVTAFGQVIVALGKYLFWTAVDGDYLNDWITHLPVGFQNAAELIGRDVASIREKIAQLVEAVRLALGGDTSQLGQIFSTIMPTLIGLLVGGLPGLLLSASRFLPTIVEGINTHLPMITSTITNIMTTMVDLITTYLPQFVIQGIEILSKVIEGIVQVLPIVVTTLVDAATTMINTFVNIIGTLLPIVLDAGIKILMAVIDGIVKNLPKMIDAALKVMDSLIHTIVKLLPQMIDAGIKIVMALIDGIIKILPQFIQTAVLLITKLCDMLLQNLPKLIDAGMKILMAVINGIIKILPKLIEAGIQIIVKLVETLIQNLPKLIESGGKIVNAVIQGIIKILPKLIETGLKLILEIVKAIIQNLPKILAAGIKIVQELIKGIVSLVGQLGSTITNSVVGTMTKKLDDAKKTFFNAGKGLMEQMKKGLEAMKGKVLDTMSSIAGKVRDFLPFSPAKTGPLSDLDHLDFGGPISDSIKLAFPKIRGLMNDLLVLPDVNMNNPGESIQGIGKELLFNAPRMMNNTISDKMIAGSHSEPSKPMVVDVTFEMDGEQLARHSQRFIDINQGDRASLKIYAKGGRRP